MSLAARRGARQGVGAPAGGRRRRLRRVRRASACSRTSTTRWASRPPASSPPSLAAAAGIGTLFGLLRLLRARPRRAGGRRRRSPASRGGCSSIVGRLARRARRRRRRARAAPRPQRRRRVGARRRPTCRRPARRQAPVAGRRRSRRRPGCRRTSRRTPTSTASTPRSSSPRSTSPTGSCASRAWSTTRSRSRYDELVAMADFEDTVTLQCVSNEVGGNLVGNATWQGVRLATLLDRAGVQPEGTQIVGHSVDGFTAGFPTEVGLDGRTALVAVGDERRAAAGRARLPGPPRRRRAVRLRVGDEVARRHRARRRGRTFDGYWVPRGWSKEGPIKTASRIDVPRSGATVDAGQQAIAGVAWQPTLGIAQGRGAGRRRRRGREATLGDVDERQHVGAVVRAVGRDVRRAPDPGAGDEHRRRDADRGACRPGARRRDRLALAHGARSADRGEPRRPSIPAPSWRGARRGCATCRGGRPATRGGSSSPRSCCSRPRCRG